MLIKTLSLLFIYVNLVLAQNNIEPFFIEHHSLFVDSTQTEFISYRIPYNQLVFTKQNDRYKAEASIDFEIFSDQKFVQREYQSFNITTNNYAETSARDKYYQGLVEFNISPGTYKLKPSLSVSSNIKEQIKLKEINLTIDSLLADTILDHFIVRHNKEFSLNNQIVNFGGQIPFSPKKMDLIVSTLDTTISYIKISISQFKTKLFVDSSKVQECGKVSLELGNNHITLNIDSTMSTCNLFYFANINADLIEGPAQLIVEFNSHKKTYPLIVNWFMKPKVLYNPEYAIKLLTYIEEKQNISELLKTSKDLYFKNLLSYWNQNFPSNGTKYNYAMKEYYSRADYAIENFSSLGTFDGAETDRGKIYITYGKPTSIDREYSEKNDIVEIWNYEKIAKSFVFKDNNGTGKFDLVE